MKKISFAPKKELVDEISDDEILEKATDLFADVLVTAIDELSGRKSSKGRAKKGRRKDERH